MSALATDATRGVALGLQNLALLTGGALGTAAAASPTSPLPSWRCWCSLVRHVVSLPRRRR